MKLNEPTFKCDVKSSPSKGNTVESKALLEGFLCVIKDISTPAALNGMRN